MISLEINHYLYCKLAKNLQTDFEEQFAFLKYDILEIKSES